MFPVVFLRIVGKEGIVSVEGSFRYCVTCLVPLVIQFLEQVQIPKILLNHTCQSCTSTCTRMRQHLWLESTSPGLKLDLETAIPRSQSPSLRHRTSLETLLSPDLIRICRLSVGPCPTPSYIDPTRLSTLFAPGGKMLDARPPSLESRSCS